MECTTCKKGMTIDNFSVQKISVAGTTYYHKACKDCRRFNRCGFEPRLTPEEKKRMLDNEDKFETMTGKGFYDLVDLKMNTDQFYYYKRNGSIKKFFEKNGATRPTI